MKAYRFVIIFLYAQIAAGQNYSFLNASTGGTETFTDADTNIYYNLGNTLIKWDKNFNQLWSRDYYGIRTFKGLLLSKTGSLYFIASDSGDWGKPKAFGKLNADGSVAWSRSATNLTISVAGGTPSIDNFHCSNVFLDSLNRLVLSVSRHSAMFGSPTGGFIVLDTLGSVLFSRLFSADFCFIPTYNILGASSDKYKLVIHGPAGLCKPYWIKQFDYSLSGDSVTSSKANLIASVCNNCGSFFTFEFYKSRINSNVFYIAGNYNNGTHPFVIEKFNGSTLLWRRELLSQTTGITSQDITDDENGNVFLNWKYYSGNNYNAGLIRFDSAGTHNGSLLQTMNGIIYEPVQKINVRGYNKYFASFHSPGYPTNPIVIQPFDTSLQISCSSSAAVTTDVYNVIMIPHSKPAVYSVTSLSLPGKTVVATPAITYSTSSNFCLIVDHPYLSNDRPLMVFPNPANEILNIEGVDEGDIESVSIYDACATLVGNRYRSKALDVSQLSQGVYFIRVVTKKQTGTVKFIRN